MGFLFFLVYRIVLHQIIQDFTVIFNGEAYMDKDTLFSQNWKTFLPRIRKMTYSYPERHREDLVQEGLIALEQACGSYDPDKGVPFDAYATVCIKRRMSTAYKSIGKHDSAVDIDDGKYSDQMITYDDLVEKRFTEDFFSDLRKELTDLEKSVLSEYLRDKTYDEIASSLSVSVKTVDNALSRIKKKIKDKYLEN